MKAWRAPEGYPNDYVVAANFRFGVTHSIVLLPDYFQGVEQVEESLAKQEFTKIVAEEKQPEHEPRIEDLPIPVAVPWDEQAAPQYGTSQMYFSQDPNDQD